MAPSELALAYDARQSALPAVRASNEADFLVLAVTWSPTLRDAAAAWRVAVAAARTTRVRPLGTLTLSAEYSRDDNPKKPWMGGVGSDVPLDIGGRRTGRLDAAGLAVLQARADYGEALWTVRAAIGRAVIALRSAGIEQAMANEALALRRSREARLEQRVAAGEDARAAQLLARSERMAAERRVADGAAREGEARLALAAAIGVPVTALGDLQLGVDKVDPVDPVAEIVAGWRRNAWAGRGEVLRAVIGYDLAEAALRTEVARQYPDVHVGPGFIFDRGLVKLPFNIALALPPSDLNRAAIAEAEVRRAAAATQLEGSIAAALASIDAAVAALNAAQINAARAQGSDLAIAAHTDDQAAQALKAGAADRVDRLATAAALVDARLAAAEAQRMHRLAIIELETAARRPLEPDEQRIFAMALDGLK